MMVLELFHSVQIHQLPTIQIITNINSKYSLMTWKTYIMSTHMAAIKLNSLFRAVMDNRCRRDNSNRAKGIPEAKALEIMVVVLEDKESHMEVAAH